MSSMRAGCALLVRRHCKYNSQICGKFPRFSMTIGPIFKDSVADAILPGEFCGSDLLELFYRSKFSGGTHRIEKLLDRVP
jgi:hypothetical protein